MKRLLILLALSNPAQAGSPHFVGNSVHFADGGTEITSDTQDLDQLADWLKALGAQTTFEVRGFLCAGDNPNDALKWDDLLPLAEGRAVKLKQALVDRGIAHERLTAVAYGRTNSGHGCRGLVIPRPPKRP